MAARIVRVAARAFAAPNTPGGGNPVTVFLAPSHLNLPSTVQSDLAKSCQWESVVAHLPTDAGRDQGQNPVLRFYMPSGEEVSFCAHAAIGAAAVVASEDGGNGANGSSSRTINFVTADGNRQSASVLQNGEAELMMLTTLDEKIVENFMALEQIRTALGLRLEDVSLGGTGLPSYVNSSVARPKTLFPMLDVSRLHSAKDPKDPDKFRDLCDKIGSTGIYLYSPLVGEEGVRYGSGASPSVDLPLVDTKQDGVTQEQHDQGREEIVARYECRQFPRWSGYPEDPATGIAAAALAASLRKRGVGTDGSTGGDSNEDSPAVERYEFYQGTAMGRRSKIGIRFEEGLHEEEEEMLRIYVSGLVEILSRDEENVS